MSDTLRIEELMEIYEKMLDSKSEEKTEMLLRLTKKLAVTFLEPRYSNIVKEICNMYNPKTRKQKYPDED